MFDFEKLEVYCKAKKFNAFVQGFLVRSGIDKTTQDQLRRASFSISSILQKVQVGLQSLISGIFTSLHVEVRLNVLQFLIFLKIREV